MPGGPRFSPPPAAPPAAPPATPPAAASPCAPCLLPQVAANPGLLMILVQPGGTSSKISAEYWKSVFSRHRRRTWQSRSVRCSPESDTSRSLASWLRSLEREGKNMFVLYAHSNNKRERLSRCTCPRRSRMHRLPRSRPSPSSHLPSWNPHLGHS